MDKLPILPEPPEKPLSSDCCGNGCSPCVLDIYEEDMRIWQQECQAIETGIIVFTSSSEEKDIPILKPDVYDRFSIISISQETPNSFRYRFSLPSSQSLGLALGQHLIVRSTPLNGVTLMRQFTPVSPIDAKGYFELIIKVYVDGRMSKYVTDWKVGDKIAMRGPLGHFDYRRNQYDTVLMVCAGTGIAPMCQVAHAILGDDEEETRIRLLYACQTYQDILAKAELDEWLHFWNFSSLYFLSQELDVPANPYKYGDEIHKGHINKSFLQSELGLTMNKTFVLLCGTPSFESDMLSYLKEIGLPQSQIHKF